MSISAASPSADPRAPATRERAGCDVLALFGTRPEVIKLAPVLRALEAPGIGMRVHRVASRQQTELQPALARELGVRIDEDLAVGRAGQTPLDVVQRVLAALPELFARTRPRCVMVQGDTSTALAGALAGFYERIPVAHVEAGLRSGDVEHPFPEEMNRRLITRVARWHFAPTAHARECLLRDGVDAAQIAVTGNPVVDALAWVQQRERLSPRIEALLAAVGARRLLLVTTHRRESFGAAMHERFRVLRRFVDEQPDVALVIPVHPNPAVREAAERELGSSERIHRIEPLDYFDFVPLMARAWLIVSDSGGVQEEAPSFGKPVLVVRDTTDRPEAVQAGMARLVGLSGDALAAALHAALADVAWSDRIRALPNPFGAGDAGPRIARALQGWLGAEERA